MSIRRVALIVVACVLAGVPATARASTPADSLEASRAFLAREMDRYHDHFGVYEDVSSPDNHFHVYAKLPDENAPVTLNGSWEATRHTGATAMKCELLPGGTGGYYYLAGVLVPPDTTPQPDFGTLPDAGYNGDLTQATSLSFWAKGEHGGEVIDFFLAGVGRDPVTGAATSPFPDSSPRWPPLGTLHTLTTSWTRITIDVSARNLGHVIGGFGWYATAANNPGGAVFYLDDIRYELSTAGIAARLEQKRFIRSYVTLPFQTLPPPVNDFDLVLRNAAFTYDNALAVLAFLAHGSADSVRRARLVGDAFVHVAAHDRTYDGDRLRNAYTAGDPIVPPGWHPNQRDQTPVIPGFWNENAQAYVEIEQDTLDTGNNAWAVVALLALWTQTGHQPYLDTALAIASGFIASQRNDSGTYQGYRGGLVLPESPTPMQRPYASSEHNIDLYAAFTRLAQITGDPAWSERAQHARALVLAMWDAGLGCYRPGTTDPETINTDSNQLALDVQPWSLLAQLNPAGRDAQVLDCALAHHAVTADGFAGFDFNTDLDGVWFEGTGQMASALRFGGRAAMSDFYRTELQRAHGNPPLGKLLGHHAASHDSLTTGFDFKYFHRLHVGATSWNLFGQRGANPYYQTTVP